MASLIIETGEGTGDVLELARGRNVLGRAEDCDFMLVDAAISSRHCELVVDDFTVKLRDLDSTNGTFLAGVPVKEIELQDGQCFKIGGLTLRLSVPPVHIAIPDLPPPETGQPPVLPDGSAACPNHTDVAARFKCGTCGRAFCDDCVHRIRLVGGKGRTLCPACSNLCVELGVPLPTKTGARSNKLLSTIRLAFTWRTPKL